MRVPTIRRRLLLAIAAGVLLVGCAASGVAIATLNGGGADAAYGQPVPARTAAPSTGLASGDPVGSSQTSAPAASTGQPSTGPARATSTRPSLAGANTTGLVVPDVIASVPGGVTAADLAAIRRLGGVRAVLAIDGARITVNGVRLTVLAAPAAALRPWTPPVTATSQRVWSAFQAGNLISTTAAAARAHLVTGGQYLVAAAVSARLTEGGSAPLGVTGVDGVVNQAQGRRLGLVRDVAVLVNAPAANPATLAARVQAALGASARVVTLVPVSTSTSLPVDANPPSGRPTNYLQLFQESAARYCPGLSWTVLAAIGQVESADGQNVGPSTAGALGPMQFLPTTWATWGIDGFGDTGAPNVMNPFDAVPSAARLLCADGAASGGAGLRQAIFDYNHATWYVDEVLALAGEYAREY